MSVPFQHVLCIDDDDDILEVVKMCLELLAGIQVSSCNNAKEALATVETLHPDIILLDVTMPDMDGPATLSALKEKPLLANVPVIFMTARVQPHEITQYLALGAAGVIPKPFDPMQLTKEMTQLWEQFHER
jgi:CheY-like chemotaxis protein